MLGLYAGVGCYSCGARRFLLLKELLLLLLLLQLLLVLLMWSYVAWVGLRNSSSGKRRVLGTRCRADAANITSGVDSTALLSIHLASHVLPKFVILPLDHAGPWALGYAGPDLSGHAVLDKLVGGDGVLIVAWIDL